MLFLLSNFLYFGGPEVKELLRAAYRDLFRYRLVSRIRKQAEGNVDGTFLKHQYELELSRTVFVAAAVSEASSGQHLLYPFRQVNRLNHKNFLGSQESLTKRIEHDIKGIKHCVFLDDFSGSGQQAMKYAAKVALEVRDIHPEVKTYLYFLVATDKSLRRIRNEACFADVDCVLELADDFRAFRDKSLYYIDPPDEIDQKRGKRVAEEYGKLLEPSTPLGFRGGQLLLGFDHNTPNNTLPILRSTAAGWISPFPRQRST